MCSNSTPRKKRRSIQEHPVIDVSKSISPSLSTTQLAICSDQLAVCYISLLWLDASNKGESIWSMYDFTYFVWAEWMETTSSTHLYKSRLMKTNVFFMSWNPLRLSQSLQSTMLTCIYCNFPSNMAKGWKIQYLQLYIHAKSAWFPRIVQENHQLSATFYCYVLVVTQWFIIIQLLLSLPMPGHTLITPFAVGQTQVCCGQLIKYSDCRHGYLFRSFLEWRSTPKIGDGHLTFHVAFLQSAYKPHIFTGKTRNIIISSKLTPSFLAYSLEKHGTWKSPLKRNIIISSKPSFLACHVIFFFGGSTFGVDEFIPRHQIAEEPMLHTTRYCSPSRSTSFSTRRRLAGGPAEDTGGEISWEHATYIFIIYIKYITWM